MSDLRPTLDQFLTCVRSEFSYLVSQYNFDEVELRGIDDFIVRYCNEETVVEVQGIAWGFGANVSVGQRNLIELLPIWPLIAERCPGHWKQIRLAGGQLKTAREYALTLPMAIPEILSGDLSVIPALKKTLEDYVAELRRLEENPPPRKLP